MRDYGFAWKGARNVIDSGCDFVLHLIMAAGCLFVMKIDQIAERAEENRRHRRPF